MGKCCSKKSRPAQYLSERKEWRRAGSPIRPEGEMTRIFMELCSPCEYFSGTPGKNGKCKICGCFLHPTSKTMNKIAWATTSCPLPDPKWKEWNTTKP